MIHHDIPHEACEVADLLRPLLKPKEDNVRLRPLCESCLGRAMLLGVAATSPLPPGYRIV